MRASRPFSTVLAAVLLSARFLLLAAGPTAAGGPAEGPAGDPAVLLAQRRLAVLGYGLSPPDGVLGGATGRALREFQRDRGLPVTGRLDRDTLEELGVDEPPPAPP